MKFKVEVEADNSIHNISRLYNHNKQVLGRLPLHSVAATNYIFLMQYFPLSDSKLKIYSKLKKNQKLGLLNRHLLGVARKLDISQIIIKRAYNATSDYIKYNKYVKENGSGGDDKYWDSKVESSRLDIIREYRLLFELVFEEINKRKSLKYLRSKKLKMLAEK